METLKNHTFSYTPIAKVMRTKGVAPRPTKEALRDLSTLLGRTLTAPVFYKIINGKRDLTVREDAVLRHYYGITQPLYTLLPTPAKHSEQVTEKIKNL